MKIIIEKEKGKLVDKERQYELVEIKQNDNTIKR